MVTPEINLEPQILYEDEHLLAITKPAGLRTIPDGYHPELPCVANIIKRNFGRIWIVHRLDKETSGIMLLARSAKTHRALNLQFERRQVSKTYQALVHAVPPEDHFTAEQPLRVNGDRQHRTIIDFQRGKPAATDFQILQRFQDCSLLQAIPHTGYTHQIRAHLAALGFPILADRLYYPHDFEPPLSAPIARTALHAISIVFTHPVTTRRMELTSPHYPDFNQLLVDLASQ